MTIWSPHTRTGLFAVAVGGLWLASFFVRVTGLITLLCSIAMIIGGVLMARGRTAGRVACLIAAPIALVLAVLTLSLSTTRPTEPALFVYTLVGIGALSALVVTVFHEHIRAGR